MTGEPTALVCGDQSWTMGELDTLHAQVGLSEEWMQSERRAELLAHPTIVVDNDTPDDAVEPS